ncbi:phosphatase PAP2 family protein [Clostridium formicaceticum]|uniref:Undecaprenyl-diphosphatase BcrC n=1 Tax=Clostridium formicaceticum TaxID=1497 RepID=A0AAC9WKM8_9CLOT|nr:phosphatase PAP2 family protein [Clostridium formicaceticum]AOY75327.1 hypothetical protein BJL90_05070 [Clostridium formicaceticum]ARE89775.1 Undecaprenyl-diphosphatase BcrC [Clostridium formicaceticum]
MKLDLKIIEFVYQHLQNPTFQVFMVILSRLGDKGLLWLVISIGLIISKKHRNIGYMSLSSILLGFIVGEVILKNLIQRARPFLVLDNIILSIAAPQSFSFPSVHTLIAFAATGVIVKKIENRFLKIGLIALATLMAFSRIYLMVHYPTDILGGVILGVIIAFVVYKVFSWRETRKKAEMYK